MKSAAVIWLTLSVYGAALALPGADPVAESEYIRTYPLRSRAKPRGFRLSGSSSEFPRAAVPGNGTLSQESGRDYSIEIQLGSSATSVLLMLDTGSTDMVINPSYVPTDDPSITSQGGSCSEAYGGVNGQRVSGTIYNAATYNLAGATLSNYFCNAQTNFVDGVIGLAFPSPNAHGVSSQTGTSPLQALQQAGITSFGVYIGNQGYGALTLGGYDATYLQGGSSATFTSESVTPGNAGHWAIGFTGFSVNGNGGTPQTAMAHIDTGSPNIRLDPTSASQILQAVGASTTDGTIACGATGPDIVFTFGSGNSYSMPSSAYIEQTRSGRCRVIVQPIQSYGSPGAATAAVIGNPFMKAYYPYFDAAVPQIQFAPSAG